MTHQDPLMYLPRRPLQDFSKRTTIYDARQPDDRLYVAISGLIKVSSTAEDGSQIISQIVGPEQIFGASSLITGIRQSETAVALENSSVMAWTRSEIEAQIEREPRLGIALMQHLAARTVDMEQRLAHVATFKTSERVALALIGLADAIGSETPDGASRISALTHQTIAEYVGTSREIVTVEMNRLRRLGMVRYSRTFIEVYAGALRDSLRQQQISVPGKISGAYQVA